MNFLAHLYLGFGDPALMAGQFISDDIKGKDYDQYEGKFRTGILLHRFVDDLTDKHPICLELRASLRDELGLFTPIAMDVFFDHILARDWNRYSDISLQDFVTESYGVLQSYHHQFTPKIQFMAEKMQEHNWLMTYTSLEGISLILKQMSRRIPRGEILASAGQVLEKHMFEVENAFHSYFPQLIEATNSKLVSFAD